MEELKKGFMSAFGVILGYGVGIAALAKACEIYKKLQEDDTEEPEEEFNDLNN